MTLALIYRPRHQYQLIPGDPYGGLNCTAYAAAMLIDAATLGGLLVTGRTVRALSTEPTPDPASPGLNIPQVVAVSKKLRVPITDFSGNTTAYARSLLGSPTVAGRRLLVQLDYGDLGAWRAPGHTRTDVPHALVVHAVRDRPGMREAALTSDPLRRTATWMPWDVIMGAALPVGGGIRFAACRRVPFIAVDD